MTSKFFFQANHRNQWFNTKAASAGGPTTRPLELAIKVVTLATELPTIIVRVISTVTRPPTPVDKMASWVTRPLAPVTMQCLQPWDRRH